MQFKSVFEEADQMLHTDKVTIANTSLNHLKGLPVGRECAVVQVYELFNQYKIFEVFDHRRGKTYFLTEDMIDRVPGSIAA